MSHSTHVSASTFETIGRVGTVVGLMLPAAGVVQRAAMFRPSSVSDDLAVIAPLPSLALTGAGSAFLGLLELALQVPIIWVLVTGHASIRFGRPAPSLINLFLVVEFALIIVLGPFPASAILLPAIVAAVIVSMWMGTQYQGRLTVVGMLPGIALAVAAAAIADGLTPSAPERTAYVRSADPVMAGWYSIVGRSPEFIYAYSCANHTVVAVAPDSMSITYPERRYRSRPDQSLWTLLRGEVKLTFGFDPICPPASEPPPGT